MKIILNGKDFYLEKSVSINELINKINIPADIFIANSFPCNGDYIIKDNDVITLIKKGDVLDKEFLEYQLISRQGFQEYNILKKSSVAICGLGGLGSNVAVSLARAGVGKLKLIDFDVVEPSNINRQCYFIDDIGKYKTSALKKIINKINPYINIEVSNIYLTVDNIIDEVSDYPVILECFDNVKSKVMLMETCGSKLKKSFIIGVSGVAGYSDTDKYKKKKIGDNCLIIGDFENEAKQGQGLYSTRVAVAANIQANEVIRHFLGQAINP